MGRAAMGMGPAGSIDAHARRKSSAPRGRPPVPLSHSKKFAEKFGPKNFTRARRIPLSIHARGFIAKLRGLSRTQKMLMLQRAKVLQGVEQLLHVCRDVLPAQCLSDPCIGQGHVADILDALTEMPQNLLS